jgi:hypothetical protein
MWSPFKQGASIGTLGSEAGVIILDDELRDEARITLEGAGATSPFAITCGIYGWMVHTRFFSSESEALSAFEAMKLGLSRILETIPFEHDPEFSQAMATATGLIEEFLEDYP